MMKKIILNCVAPTYLYSELIDNILISFMKYYPEMDENKIREILTVNLEGYYGIRK